MGTSTKHNKIAMVKLPGGNDDGTLNGGNDTGGSGGGSGGGQGGDR